MTTTAPGQGPVTRGRRLAPTRPRRRRCRASRPTRRRSSDCQDRLTECVHRAHADITERRTPVPFRDARFQFYPRAFTSVQGRADVAVRDGCNPRGLPHAAD